MYNSKLFVDNFRLNRKVSQLTQYTFNSLNNFSKIKIEDITLISLLSFSEEINLCTYVKEFQEK